MTKVSARYEISGNYLARVCQHLNVPHPPRGYWAKLEFGKAPKRPPLPDVRPGEVVEWERGDWVPKPDEVTEKSQPTAEPTKQSKLDRPSHHALVDNVQELFEKARFSDVGYLRPTKRNLVDIFVSQPTLAYALDTANILFLASSGAGIACSWPRNRIIALNFISMKGRRNLSITATSPGDQDN